MGNFGPLKCQYEYDDTLSLIGAGSGTRAAKAGSDNIAPADIPATAFLKNERLEDDMVNIGLAKFMK
jgi:hypothetical protein